MKLLHRNRRSKRGSSLPMVMAIGAALVIWVMALLPLMATSGTTAAQTKLLEANYLSSKSSIEFVKGELTEMVKGGVPKPFVVWQDDSGIYHIEMKLESNGSGVRSGYLTYVDSKSEPNTGARDADDEPKLNSVVALCGVEQTSGNIYKITIRTYNNGEEGTTYTATYTGAGKMKIFPEAYKQTQAMPLSDFVLVDGKLGDRTVWTSTIGNKDNYTGSFAEYLNPIYATETENARSDAGKYPIVFKRTAETAKNGATEGEGTSDNVIVEGSTPLEDPTPQEWYMPTASDFTFDPDSHKVSIASGSPLSGKVTLNASKADTKIPYLGLSVSYNYDSRPTGTGTYRVTVDVESTGDYRAEKKINVLAASNLAIGTFQIGDEKAEVKAPSISVDSKNHKVTFSNVDGSVECYYRENGGNLQRISINNGYGSHSLNSSSTYTFYYRVNGREDDGIVYTPSDYICCGSYAPTPGAVSSLTDGQKYLICRETGKPATDADGNPLDGYKQYVVLKQDQNDSSKLTVEFINLPTDLSNFDASSISRLFWTYEKSESSHRLKYGNSSDSNKSYLAISNNSVYMVGNNDNARDLKVTDGNTVNGQPTIHVYRTVKSGRRSYNYYLSLNTKNSQNPYISPRSSSEGALLFIAFPESKSVNGSNISVPSISLSDGNHTYKDVSFTSLLNLLSNNSIQKVYLNGEAYNTNDTDNIPVGQYTIHVQVSGNSGSSFDYVPVSGTLTVNPKSAFLEGSVDASISNYNADISYNWSSNGFDINDYVKYYGYKVDSGYRWFPEDTISNLSIGSYTFAVWRANSKDYTYVPLDDDSTAEVVHPKVSFDDTDGDSVPDGTFSQFTYKQNDDGSISWYRLPSGVRPSRVTILYGTKNSSYNVNNQLKPGGYNWSETAPRNEKNTIVTADAYAVVIENAVINSKGRYNKWTETAVTRSNPIVIIGPSNVASVTGDGYFDSLIMGSSIYFMGNNYSIDTNGAKVTVNADLLVLRDGIDKGTSGDGMVVVYPYNLTRQAGAADGLDYTLLYVAEDTGDKMVFEARTFYKVKSGTDIANVTAIDGERVIKLGTIPGAGSTNAGSIPTAVRDLFNSNVTNPPYPEMIADIAYATKAQLDSIVSSETMGWTKDGVLQNSGTYSSDDKDTYNVKYAVCAYITKGTSVNDTKYAANRVLVASPNNGSGADLSVSSVMFITRYLSLDMDSISGSSLVVRALTDTRNGIETIIESIFRTNLVSDTVQVDFKQNTSLNSTSSIDANVYRYSSNSDLLGGAIGESDLVINYSVDTLHSRLQRILSADRTDIQDRYVRFSGTGNSTLQIKDSELFGLFSSSPTNVYIYTNFWSIEGITKIDLSAGSNILNKNPSVIKLNTLENGYDTAEYLGLFKGDTAESYQGVMLHCANAVEIVHKSGNVTIDKGLYFISSEVLSDKSSDKYVGDNFYELAKSIRADENAVKNGTKNEYGYRVNEQWLYENAAYISLDGKLNNSYVDSDLLGGGSGSGMTGFSGGGLQ